MKTGNRDLCWLRSLKFYLILWITFDDNIWQNDNIINLVLIVTIVTRSETVKELCRQSRKNRFSFSNVNFLQQKLCDLIVQITLQKLRS